MDYLKTIYTKCLALSLSVFLITGISAQDCEDPDSFEVGCGVTIDLCIDREKLPDDGTIDILVTANDNLGIFDPCDIELPDDPEMLSHFGFVEPVVVDGVCKMRYTLTDPAYEPLDSFFYIFNYTATCSLPPGYCENGGKIWTIESKYYGEDGAAVVVSAKEGSSKSPFDTIYNLDRGDLFFIDGTDLAVNQTEWTFRFYSEGDLNSAPFSVAPVHTSCSQEIFGVDFGVFTPLGGCVSSFNQRGTCVDRSILAVSNDKEERETVYRMENEVDVDLVVDTTIVYIFLGESGLLPIEFSMMTGRAVGKNNQLSWDIASVVDEDYLFLQSSTDGRVFKDIMKTKDPKAGSFEFLDEKVSSAVTYYRFKMISVNGHETFSRRITVKNKSFKESGVKVFPNPVKDVIHFQGDREIEGLKIFSISGQLLHSQIVKAEQISVRTQDLNLSHGIYYVEFQLDNQTRVIEKFSVL